MSKANQRWRGKPWNACAKRAIGDHLNDGHLYRVIEWIGVHRRSPDNGRMLRPELGILQCARCGHRTRLRSIVYGGSP